MNQERLLKIIVGPVISEKAMMAAEGGNQHVFKVVPDATKLEIKKAVETFFNVKVEKVRTVNVKGKAKRFGMIQGRRPSWKKAYVTLAEGQEIEFGAGE